MSTKLGLVLLTLAIALIVSIVLNWALFARAKQYYIEANRVHLDPLGLSEKPPLISPDHSTAKPVVAFLGDSRAAMWPSPPTLTQFEFVNRGIGGQSSAQALLRFDYDISLARPNVIIIQIGVNDLKNIPILPECKQDIVANCKHNIEQIVSKSSKMGATVILTTIFPVSTVPLARRPFWSPEVDRAIEEINAFLGTLEAPPVIIFDAYTLLAPQRTAPGIYADELHLDAAGYEMLNDELARVLAQLDLK